MATKLVPFNREIFEKSIEWLSDNEIKRLTHTPDSSLESKKEWFGSLKYRIDYFIWGVEYKSRIIGVTGIKNIDYSAKVGEFFGYIGEKELWGMGLGTEMIQSVIQEARKISLERLILSVLVDNERAIHLYQKSGFKETGKDTIMEYMELQLDQ